MPYVRTAPDELNRLNIVHLPAQLLPFDLDDQNLSLIVRFGSSLFLINSIDVLCQPTEAVVKSLVF